jgi:hypothetical protein
MGGGVITPLVYLHFTLEDTIMKKPYKTVENHKKQLKNSQKTLKNRKKI